MVGVQQSSLGMEKIGTEIQYCRYALYFISPSDGLRTLVANMQIFETFLCCFTRILIHCTSMYTSFVFVFAPRTVFKKLHITNQLVYVINS